MHNPRSETVSHEYEKFKARKLSEGADLHTFTLADETIVREFNYWLIIENRFPYDNMTSLNHLLIPRRPFADFTEATEEELAEHRSIRNQLATEGLYDAVVENFPHAKSVTRYAHLHLVRWKENPLPESYGS